MKGPGIRTKCAAFAALVFVAACGGASHPTNASNDRAVTLAVVIRASSHIRTYGFAAKVLLPPDDAGERMKISVTGVTDEAARRSRLVDSQPGERGHEEMILDRHATFDRVDSPELDVAHGWCSLSALKRSSGPQISLAETLTTLGTRKRAIDELGTEVVRGIPTTVYRASGAGLPPVRIWVDDHDQLRRLRWTHGGGQTDSTDFFDFNKPVTIELPVNAPACFVTP